MLSHKNIHTQQFGNYRLSIYRYFFIYIYYIEIALNALEKFVRSQCI